MTRESDREYFARRAADERLAAEQAADESLATLHSKLADRYAELAGPADHDQQRDLDRD